MNTMSFKHNLFINFKVVVAVNCTLRPGEQQDAHEFLFDVLLEMFLQSKNHITGI